MYFILLCIFSHIYTIKLIDVGMHTYFQHVSRSMESDELFLLYKCICDKAKIIRINC